VIDSPPSVLIVDDSALMRNLVSRIFEAAPDFRIAGTAMNGLFALRKIEQERPDLIVLDLEMPEMNGIEFLRERQKRGIDIPVIILSSIAEKGARITMEALALGASDFILKPGGVTTSQDLKGTAGELLELARVYTRRGQRHAGEGSREPSPPPRAAREAERREHREEPRAAAERITPLRGHGAVEVIAIGISTGGPNALREVLPKIEATVPPLLIVQHMPAGFTEEFAESLNRLSTLEVREARDGDVLKQGRAFIAPGNAHLTVEAKPLARVIRLSDAPPMSGHRPSADVLFASIAKVYGNRCLAAIMTGMGKDGAVEIGSIYREGGITIAQDEHSCIVYGMPRAAVESGVIHHVVPLPRMAETINRLCREHPPE
jgi:two-component system, chemotaxis family, protein-glutamate methylesterase/glutaminase